MTDTKAELGGSAAAQPAVYYVGALTDVGAVLYRTSESVIDRYPYPVVTQGELDQRDPALWPIVTAVLTDDPYTVERVARVLAAGDGIQWADTTQAAHGSYRQAARTALAAVVPVRCNTCRRVVPTREVVAGYATCGYCPKTAPGGAS